MNDYAIRCTQADVPQLLALAERLGVLSPHTDLEGNPTGGHGLHSDRRGGWDVLGTIYRPTGGTVRHTMPGGYEIEVPKTEAVCDEAGEPYWHANLRIDIDLAERAREMAAGDPEIAEALANLSRWFVIDPETGHARLPKSPARVWA